MNKKYASGIPEAYFLFILWERCDEPVDEEETDDTGDDICSRLRDLDTEQTKQGSAEKQKRYRDGTAADHRQDGGDAGLLDALVQHIHRNGHRHEHHADSAVAHRCRADTNDIGVGLEQFDDAVREDDADQGHTADEYDAEPHGKEHTFLHTAVLPRLMIEGCYRLEALSHTEADTHQERGIFVHDAHCRDGCITKGFRNVVEDT